MWGSRRMHQPRFGLGRAHLVWDHGVPSLPTGLLWGSVIRPRIKRSVRTAFEDLDPERMFIWSVSIRNGRPAHLSVRDPEPDDSGRDICIQEHSLDSASNTHLTFLPASGD